jgi:hypothetical protein
MELKCELSPLVFAELYRMLAADSDRADVLYERLGQIGLEYQWLEEAAELYEGKWNSLLAVATSIGDYVAHGADHSVLASWVLAGLRQTGSSYDFGSELRQRVTERALSELDPRPVDLPSQCRPVVIGWTLGMVLGDLDQQLPVAPAFLPADVNVRAAYEGFVEHVLHLQRSDPPWPEMMGTATFWRGTGLAEGLRPDAENGAAAIRNLIIEVRHAAPDHLGREIGRHFEPFADQRNTLSHIADKPGKPRFIDVKELARDWDQIRLTVSGVTYFLCAEVAGELTESAARVVRPETWDELKWEVRVY